MYITCAINRSIYTYNSFYYNIEVLTRPGAKGCNYGHSTRQETGLSVLPVDVTKHVHVKNRAPCSIHTASL